MLSGLRTHLRRFVASVVREELEEILLRARHVEATDIQLELQRMALRETAEFVANNVPLTCIRFPSKERLLEECVQRAPSEGLVLEFGVFRGESINRLAELMPGRRIFGFDSFEGLPDRWFNSEARTFAVDTGPEVRSNVTLQRGWFRDSLPAFLAAHRGKCAFIHIDCDMYQSTKDVFDRLHDRIGDGTVILFDEFFNYPGWQDHEFKAFKEYVTDRRVCSSSTSVQPSAVRTSTSQAVIKWPCELRRPIRTSHTAPRFMNSNPQVIRDRFVRPAARWLIRGLTGCDLSRQGRGRGQRAARAARNTACSRRIVD